MSCKNHKHPPEPNRLIRCKGEYSDALGGELECVGMFIPYKDKTGPRAGQARFCVQRSSGEWAADRATWIDVVSWEYVRELQVPIPDSPQPRPERMASL